MNDEIYLIDILQAIWKRRYLIIAVSLVSALLSLVFFLNQPKIYEGEAVIALPTGGSTSETIISAPETKALVNIFINDIKKNADTNRFETELLRNIVDIKVDQVKGSNNELSLIVKVKSDPKKVIDVCNKIIENLRNNDYVKRKFNFEKVALETNFSETNKAIIMATKTRDEAMRLMSTRNPIGFNPIGLDIGLNELKTKAIILEKNISLSNGYEFISGPNFYNKPIGPRTISYTLIAGIGGFLFGVLFVCTIEFRKNISLQLFNNCLL